ncbi:MAG: 6-hydroxymethylpterin diphosphokinase MptE-like protein [Bacteroidota bacterium]
MSLLKVLIRSKFTTNIPKGNEESCLILGNGPSLNVSLQKHPEFFKQHKLICVNSFSITDLYELLKPSYYVILDPRFWFADDQVNISSIESIKIKTKWQLTLFVPYLAKKSNRIKTIIDNPNIRIHYFNYTVFKGFESIAFRFYKQNLAMSQSQNVLVGALFLSINMGFKKIYLFGADHNWHNTLFVTEANIPCIKNVHFYETEEQVEYRPLYKGPHTTEIFRMDEILEALSKTFYGYYAINRYAKHMNCDVYNANENSAIDSFERIKIKDISTN